MKYAKVLANAFLLCSSTLLFSGCSGSGESGTGSGGVTLSALILPEKVSVVDPQTTTSSKPLPGKTKSLMAGITGTALPAQSDYDTDRVTVYVNERSLESFATVNEILCMLRQSRYDAMINKGTYIAQVDKNLCSSTRDNAAAGQQTANQSSGAAMPVYETWKVNSFRAGSQSPHIVQAWIHSAQNNPNDPETVIHAKVVIDEGADTAPPYGIFRANFKALDKETQSTVLFKGFLNAERDAATGKVLLKFSTEDKDSYIIEKATLDKSTDGKTGAGSVFKAESYPGITPRATRFNIAYNETNFKRIDNNMNEICLDRASPPDVSAWRYALYNADGSRVSRNSGFTIRIGDTYGWIGYWGAWFPGSTRPNNGDVVLKHDYRTNSDTAYTLIRAGGKLKQHTRRVTNLAAIKNIPLVSWDSAGNTIQVVWDSAKKAFFIVGQLDAAGSWQTLTAPTLYSLTALPWVELGFWSQSLGGMVIVKFPPPVEYGAAPTGTACGYNPTSNLYDCSLVAAAQDDASLGVIYYSENIVYPGDGVPAVLACFDNCPDVNALSTNAPFRSDIVSYQSVTPGSSTYAAYRFDNAGMILYSGASGTIPVITAATGADFPGGVTSGPLFDPAVLTPVATIASPLGCDWAPFSETCGGKAWSSLPVFYTWETGPNEWNLFTGLKDADGIPVKFEPPLQVEYTHKLAGSKYENTKFYLQYGGFGDLQGIPGKCVNVDTGADGVDCSGGDPAVKWVPEFNIPDIDPVTQSITTVADVLSQGTEYLVKALEKEQRMKTDLTPGACASLDASPYVLPSMSSYIDPVIGTEPIVTDAPSVIGGIVQ